MLVAVRKVMEKIFNLHELEVLDDLMPESIKKKQADEAAKKKDDDYDTDEDEDDDEDGCNHFDDTDGKKVITSISSCNGHFSNLHHLKKKTT